MNCGHNEVARARLLCEDIVKMEQNEWSLFFGA